MTIASVRVKALGYSANSFQHPVASQNYYTLSELKYAGDLLTSNIVELILNNMDADDRFIMI